MHLFIGHRPKTTIWIVVGSRRIRQEHHPVVEEHRIARRCVTTIFRRRARDDDRINAPFTQDDVEVGSEEAAITMLLNDVFASSRGYFGIYLDARSAIHHCGKIWRQVDVCHRTAPCQSHRDDEHEWHRLP